MHPTLYSHLLDINLGGYLYVVVRYIPTQIIANIQNRSPGMLQARFCLMTSK